MKDELIGMTKAAEILQVSGSRVAQSILKKAQEAGELELIEITPRALAVRVADVEKLAQKRGGKIGPGRPPKVKLAEGKA